MVEATSKLAYDQTEDLRFGQDNIVLYVVNLLERPATSREVHVLIQSMGFCIDLICTRRSLNSLYKSCSIDVVGYKLCPYSNKKVKAYYKVVTNG